MHEKFCSFLIVVLTSNLIKSQILEEKLQSIPSFFVINGVPAPSGAFPFIVSLGLINQTNYLHRCGASIISQDFILTAAHCVTDIGNDYDPQFYKRQTGQNLVVIAGIDSLDPSGAFSETEIYLIQRVTYNLNYKSITDPFDIAVLKTARKINFNSRVRTIRLPSTLNPGVVFGKRMVVLGWGITENGRPSNLLRMAQMNSINFMGSRGECDGLDSKFYCMKDLRSTQSNVCFGDSGGPLINFENNNWVLYGLTSFGKANNQGECINTSPSFFTMVPSLISWIRLQIRTSLSQTKPTINFV